MHNRETIISNKKLLQDSLRKIFTLSRISIQIIRDLPTIKTLIENLEML